MRNDRRQRSIWAARLRLLCLTAVTAQAQLGTVGGPGFIVFGRVYLPDGKPASRVKVYLEMPNGLSRYIPSDDGGNEEAKQRLQQGLKLNPEAAARAHVYLAEVYAHEQKFKEAADEIHAYLKAKSDAADAANLKKMEADWREKSRRQKQD